VLAPVEKTSEAQRRRDMPNMGRKGEGSDMSHDPQRPTVTRADKNMDLVGWTPVLRGDVYCSPRCGGGCTTAEFDKAYTAAASLAERMGRGWAVRVWENLGWHWKVQCGNAEITPPDPSGSNKYTARLQFSPQFIARADEPEDALGFAVQDCRTHIQRLQDELAQVLIMGDRS